MKTELVPLEKMEILHPQLRRGRRPERGHRNVPAVGEGDSPREKRVADEERRRRVEAVEEALERRLHLRHDGVDGGVEGVGGETEVREGGEGYVAEFGVGGGGPGKAVVSNEKGDEDVGVVGDEDVGEVDHGVDVAL